LTVPLHVPPPSATVTASCCRPSVASRAVLKRTRGRTPVSPPALALPTSAPAELVAVCRACAAGRLLVLCVRIRATAARLQGVGCLPRWLLEPVDGRRHSLCVAMYSVRPVSNHSEYFCSRITHAASCRKCIRARVCTRGLDPWPGHSFTRYPNCKRIGEVDMRVDGFMLSASTSSTILLVS